MKTERLIPHRFRAEYVEMNWCDKCKIEERYKILRDELKNMDDEEVAAIAFNIIRGTEKTRHERPAVKRESAAGRYARSSIYSSYQAS